MINVNSIMDFTSRATRTNEGLINVDGSEDPCYRYKMQSITTSYIAKNGGTTIIDNAKPIAHDIYRELADLRSCFSKGIAGRVQIINETLSIPGRHTETDLQQILAKYISTDVLCETCGSPETPLWKKRKRKCRACGHVRD